MAAVKTNGNTIVVVVQDLFFAVRISDVLRAIGYKGTSVQDKGALRRILGEVRPHMVILDLQATGLTPEDVVSAIRDAGPGRAIPVLAFGPHADVKKREEALRAGCQKVVPKSVLSAELPQLVKNMLRP